MALQNLYPGAIGTICANLDPDDVVSLSLTCRDTYIDVQNMMANYRTQAAALSTYFYETCKDTLFVSGEIIRDPNTDNHFIMSFGLFVKVTGTYQNTNETITRFVFFDFLHMRDRVLIFDSNNNNLQRLKNNAVETSLFKHLVTLSYQKSIHMVNNRSAIVHYYYTPDNIEAHNATKFVEVARAILLNVIKHSRLIELGQGQEVQEVQNNIVIMENLNDQDGGQKNKKATVYVKTTQKHRGKDGIERILYSKGDSMYVKKKSAKTGKMVYMKVKQP